MLVPRTLAARLAFLVTALTSVVVSWGMPASALAEGRVTPADGALHAGLNSIVWQDTSGAAPATAVVEAVRVASPDLTVTAIWALTGGQWSYYLAAAPSASTLQTVPPLASLFVVLTSPSQYVAVGDSNSVGVGADDPATTAWTPIFHRWLRANYDSGMGMRNFAVRGETTTSMIETGQLQRALDFIRAQNGDGDPANDVRVISVGIGGNDTRRQSDQGAPCAPPNTASDSCRTAQIEALKTVRRNTAHILQSLRGASGPQTVILVTTYFNPFSGSAGPLDNPSTDLLTRALNAGIAEDAANPAVGGIVADFYSPFVGRALTLTHIASGDVHANNAGHALLAQAIIDAFRQR